MNGALVDCECFEWWVFAVCFAHFVFLFPSLTTFLCFICVCFEAVVENEEFVVFELQFLYVVSVGCAGRGSEVGERLSGFVDGGEVVEGGEKGAG